MKISANASIGPDKSNPHRTKTTLCCRIAGESKLSGSMAGIYAHTYHELNIIDARQRFCT